MLPFINQNSNLSCGIEIENIGQTVAQKFRCFLNTFAYLDVR